MSAGMTALCPQPSLQVSGDLPALCQLQAELLLITTLKILLGSTFTIDSPQLWPSQNETLWSSKASRGGEEE